MMKSKQTRRVNKRANDAILYASALMDVGRGAVVDEKALVNALRRDAIAGAALDVFAVEPLPEVGDQSERMT